MENNDSFITNCGHHNCEDLHSWGPGMRDIHILHYIIKGSGFLQYGNNHYTIKAGQSFIIYPYTVTKYYPNPDDPWEYVWINFGGATLEKLLDLIDFERGNCVIGCVDKEIILPYFLTLIEKYDYNNHNKLYCEGLFRTIIGILTDKYPKATKYNLLNERFEIAVLIIKNNYYHSDFSIETIQKKMGMSRITLYRLFMDCVGLSPNKYLTNYRISQAKFMLNKQISVKDTALSCGFWDPLYFSRVFRANTTISPKEYREKHKVIGDYHETNTEDLTKEH